MWQVLLKLVDPVLAITEKLADAYVARQVANDDGEKAKLEVKIKELEARRDLLMQEQQFRLTRWIRPLLAYPVAFYLAKIWVLDAALGLGTSDPVSEELQWVMMAIISSYFVTRPFEKVLKK